MAATTDAQPQDQPDGTRLGTGAVKAEEPSKPPVRGKKNATSKYPKESQAMAPAPAKPKEKHRPPAIEVAPAHTGREVEATPNHQTQMSITVSSVSSSGSTPAKDVSHSRRPKAADSDKTVNTSVEAATRSPVSIPAGPKPPNSRHALFDGPPKTPEIPWDEYGLTLAWAELQTLDMRAAYHPARQGAPQRTPGISPQNRFSPWPSDSGDSELVLAPQSAPSPTRKRPKTKRREIDSHDKEMSEAYIPLSPSFPPWDPNEASPRLPSQRGPAVAARSKPSEFSEAEAALIFPHPLPEEPTVNPTPPPTITDPLSLSGAEAETASGANPGIWNLGSNPTPRHAVRHTPARPGTVCCETCFRDELARWTRMRDGVVGLLKLLGGQPALREVRVLAEEVEGCHKDSGESKDWGVPHLNEYPADVVGLVLLRVMAERPTSGLAPRQRDEADKLLEGLRRDVGVGLKSFDALTTVCKARLVCWRVEGREQPSRQGGDDRWWWDFDDSLQAADHRFSTTRYPPSLFASTLSRKSFEMAVAALSASEAITAQAGDNMPTSHQTSTTTFAQLERALGLPTPNNLFLKTTGDMLALARRQTLANLTPSTQPPSSSIATTTTAGASTSTTNTNHNSTNKRPDPSSPSTSPPPAKRHKPNTTTPATTILPCIHCSHSTASHQHILRATTTTHATKQPPQQPRTRPCHPDKLIQTERDRLHFLAEESGRALQVVEICPPGHEEWRDVVSVMVDGTGGGMRIVVVAMRGVFEVVFGGADGRFGRFPHEGLLGHTHGGVVGVARPVGRWERWRGGRLEGWREV